MKPAKTHAHHDATTDGASCYCHRTACGFPTAERTTTRDLDKVTCVTCQRVAGYFPADPTPGVAP